MIRINLLGVPKAKKASRQAISIGGGANTMVIGLIVAALFAGGNYYYYS
jgi:hypothetical protein